MSFNNFFFSLHNYIVPLLASHTTVFIHDERLYFVCEERYVDTVVRYVLCLKAKGSYQLSVSLLAWDVTTSLYANGRQYTPPDFSSLNRGSWGTSQSTWDELHE